LFTDLSYKLSFAFQMIDLLVGVGAYYLYGTGWFGRGAYHGYEPFAFHPGGGWR